MDEDFDSTLEDIQCLEEVTCPNCENDSFAVLKNDKGIIVKLICTECQTVINQ